jgi:hypothetical protein
MKSINPKHYRNMHAQKASTGAISNSAIGDFELRTGVAESELAVSLSVTNGTFPGLSRGQ